MVSNLTLKKLKLYVTCQHLRTNMHCSSSQAWKITYQNSFPSTVTPLVLWYSWFIRMWSGAGMRLMRRKTKTSFDKPPSFAVFWYVHTNGPLSRRLSTWPWCSMLTARKACCICIKSPHIHWIKLTQIEKEMLLLVFATNKFHDFIYGRPVTV